jgi:transcriptional regulator with XRE-family HTH domain
MTTDELCAEIGRRVRDARDRHPDRLSQAALASAVGVERVSITNLESGKHVTLKLLHRVAVQVGVELRDLIPPILSQETSASRVPAKAAAVIDALLDELGGQRVR